MSNEGDILFGLPPKVIDLIVGTISKNVKIKKIILFGSRAKGNYKRSSDIDLALFSEDLNHNELLKIKVEISELMVPNKIDIVDFNKITNNDLRDHIERVGKTLFST